MLRSCLAFEGNKRNHWRVFDNVPKVKHLTQPKFFHDLTALELNPIGSNRVGLKFELCDFEDEQSF